MIDQRLASVSRNLREQGYVDNDPDATLAAIRLIALADALQAQQTDAFVRSRREDSTATESRDTPETATEDAQPARGS